MATLVERAPAERIEIPLGTYQGVTPSMASPATPSRMRSDQARPSYNVRFTAVAFIHLSKRAAIVWKQRNLKKFNNFLESPKLDSKVRARGLKLRGEIQSIILAELKREHPGVDWTAALVKRLSVTALPAQ
ncbi:MAG: hypothetical protein Aurels2KO_46230 [Aureliella sp.]